MFDRTFSGVLGPQFAQLKHIGGGANGSVYSGFDRRFDFAVCIKRVSVTNKDDCRAALREIRIRRRLRHENILGLLNGITSDGTDVSKISPANFRDTTCIYFIQELLDADLRQVIESTSRLSDDYVKLFFYQLLRGLKYIHSANVLHRDLKPSNVLVNVSSLELVIGDFGHAIVLDPQYVHTSDQVSCNTSLWYKAPELILGSSRYSTASDMWAVGCILAEMLLGRPLFEGENDLEQLELIIHTIEINERDQGSVRECLTEEVNKMYTGKPKFPLRSKFQKVDFHALHLLEHLLSFNAGDRVTTDLALSHPFLHEYACVGDEPVCLKPLHLEHEVDDFLEYTLKDMIVGECVALAEERPRIQMQMSSYSSIMDIVKELNHSPPGSNSHSVDDGKPGTFVKAMVGDGLTNGTEGESFRLKNVLEVLKEEHTSSSDSNGMTSHEDGVKEEPLVSDHAAMVNSHRLENDHHKITGQHRRISHHRRKTSTDESTNRVTTPHEEFDRGEPLVSDQAATMCSERWKHERHRGVHRRHHTHHRRKTSADESSRSRKTKLHTNHSLERETLSDSNLVVLKTGGLSPECYTPDSQSPVHGSYNDLSLQSDRLRGGVSEPIPSSESSDNLHEDDKVKELINKSQQLIADHIPEEDVLENGIENGLRGNPSSEKHDSLPTRESEGPDGNILGAKLGSVADVIRRSRELLGEIVEDDGSEPAIEETSYVPTLGNVPEYSPMVSDPYHLRESDRRMQELLEESHTLLNSFPTEPYTASFESGRLADSGSLNSILLTSTHCELVSGGISTNMPSDQQFPFDKPLNQSGGSVGVLSLGEALPPARYHRTDDIDLDEMKAVVEKARELLKQTEEAPPAASDRMKRLEREGDSPPVVAESLGSSTTCLKNIEASENSPPTETQLNLLSSDHPTDTDAVPIVNEQCTNVPEAAAEDVLEQPNLITMVISENWDQVTCGKVCPPEPAPALNQQAIVLENAVVREIPDSQEALPCKNVARHFSDNCDDSAVVHVGKTTNGDDDSELPAGNAGLVGGVTNGQRVPFLYIDTSQLDGLENGQKYLPDGKSENIISDDDEFSCNFTPQNSGASPDFTTPNIGEPLKFPMENDKPSPKITVQNDETPPKFTAPDHGDALKSSAQKYTDVESVVGGESVQRSAFERNKISRGYQKQLRGENDFAVEQTELCSKDIVGTFCRSNCRSAEKSARESHAGLLTRDEAGLNSFYATIKINTLMNRTRTFRDRLHEPYPF